MAILTGSGIARADEYSIAVDASAQTGDTPRFWTASVGTGIASLTLRADLQMQYKIAHRELGFQRVRGHGVLSSLSLVSEGAPPGVYNWSAFDTYLEAIVSAGMRPVMELSFMPSSLGSNQGNPTRSPPRNMDAYKRLIQAVVQRCVDRYGVADVSQWYWEVWNEPDYSAFWTGTMADYYALYDAAVDAASSVIPNILIGGPAATEPHKIGAFLQHCHDTNTRVTFVSSHCYPGHGGSSRVNATDLLTDNDARVAQINSAGYATAAVRSFNTEWNSSDAGQGGRTGDSLLSMDNHWNVGFILKSIKSLFSKDIDLFSYWALSDIFDESGSGPWNSYVLDRGGDLPFARVFGLMTAQGVRKASFNAFKLLAYLGPKRLQATGGTDGDGVDAVATVSASGDELQILVYDYFARLDTPGSDEVALSIDRLPPQLAGHEVFVTEFRVDEYHSNPYLAWTNQGRPSRPTEWQWQDMRRAQHLALAEPVTKVTLGTTYARHLTMSRQGASLVIVGLNRPLIGRNALVAMEAEDYDGQSAMAREDSRDIDLGQSVVGNSGSYLFFDSVDFSDVGVGSVQLRVKADRDATLELRARSGQTDTLLGKCSLGSTAGTWLTQTCKVTQTKGVGVLYLLFADTVRLNWLKFEKVDGTKASAPNQGTGDLIALGWGRTNRSSSPDSPAMNGCACTIRGPTDPSGDLAVLGVVAVAIGRRLGPRNISRAAARRRQVTAASRAEC